MHCTGLAKGKNLLCCGAMTADRSLEEHFIHELRNLPTLFASTLQDMQLCNAGMVRRVCEAIETDPGNFYASNLAALQDLAGNMEQTESHEMEYRER